MGKVIRKKRAQVLIEKSYLSDPSISRLIIIGGIVIDYFPELLSLTPQKSEFENKIEFAPLLKFLKFLGPRRNLLSRFIKIKSVGTHNNQN